MISLFSSYRQDMRTVVIEKSETSPFRSEAPAAGDKAESKPSSAVRDHWAQGGVKLADKRSS